MQVIYALFFFFFLFLLKFMNNGVDLVLSTKKKKVQENVLGLHNQIFHFGLINKKKKKNVDLDGFL